MLAELAFGLALLQSPPVTAELVTSITGVKPGDTFIAGVLLRIEPGWHIYWSNPGDAGAATSVEWSLPPGWKASDLRWPTPTRFQEKANTVYGYDGSTLLLSRITAPADAKTGKFILSAHVSWVAGGKGTLPGSLDLKLTRSVNDDTYTHPTWGQRLTEADSVIPHGRSGWSFVAIPTKGGYILKTRPDTPIDLSSKLPVFFASVPGVLEASAPQNFREDKDGSFWLALKATDKPAERLTGILVMPAGDAVAVDVPITPSSSS